MSSEMDSYLKPFKGQGDNFEAFWAKFEVFAEVRKWNSEDIHYGYPTPRVC